MRLAGRDGGGLHADEAQYPLLEQSGVPCVEVVGVTAGGHHTQVPGQGSGHIAVAECLTGLAQQVCFRCCIEDVFWCGVLWQIVLGLSGDAAAHAQEMTYR